MRYHTPAGRKHFLLGMLLLFTALGCEHSVDNPEWPEYKEKLVVVAKCESRTGDSLMVSCAISRTLPLNAIWSERAANVNDAKVTITCDGRDYDIPADSSAWIYPDAVNHANYRAVLHLRDTHSVTLTVKHGVLSASSSLLLNKPPPLDTIRILKQPDGVYSLAAAIRPTDNTCIYRLYGVLRFVNSGQDTLWSIGVYGTFVEPQDRTNVWRTLETYMPKAIDGRFRVIVVSQGGTSYSNARFWSSGNGDPFDEQTGKNPRFNVTGDGIGFFWYVLWGPEVEVKW